MIRALAWFGVVTFGLAALSQISVAASGHGYGVLLVSLALTALCAYPLWKHREEQWQVDAAGVGLGPVAPAGMICSQCYSMNTGRNQSEGGRSAFWFLVLVLFTMGFWLIYLAFKSPAKRFKQCSACGARDSMLPTSSPRGYQLWKDHHSKT